MLVVVMVVFLPHFSQFSQFMDVVIHGNRVRRVYIFFSYTSTHMKKFVAAIFYIDSTLYYGTIQYRQKYNMEMQTSMQNAATKKNKNCYNNKSIHFVCTSRVGLRRHKNIIETISFHTFVNYYQQKYVRLILQEK